MLLPKMHAAVPILASLNITASVRFYTDALGFTCRHEAAGEYAIVQRDSIEIHFWACSERHIAENTACRIGVTGIDTLFDSYLPRGVIHPNGKLHDTEWGTREFAILDPDGNLITFFERRANAA